MWACFHKACFCLPRRGDTRPPFDHYSYDDDDNMDLENLLAQQEPDTLGAFLTRPPPFQRTRNTQGYIRANQLSLGDDIIDDEAIIQTQDAQFLPDEQISKLTELTIEQLKSNQATDAQFAAEEAEARRLEEAEIEQKRQAARQAAISKGLLPLVEEDTLFTITGDDEDAEEFGESSVKLSGTNQSGSASRQLEEQVSILNKPRNPHQRLFTSEINPEDYEDDGPPPTNSKDQSPILVETPLGPPLSATIREAA